MLSKKGEKRKLLNLNCRCKDVNSQLKEENNPLAL